MQKQRIGMVMVVLALLSAAGVIAWAQGGDTPIVILDGSLSMQSAVPWSQFTGTGDQRFHPNKDGSIAKVVVTVNGKNQSIACNQQSCTVDILYAGTDILLASGVDGKGLMVSPFSAFDNGATPDMLVHKNQKAKISHVTVSMSGVKLIDLATTGGTKVTISYR
jgi:hypothetical protein